MKTYEMPHVIENYSDVNNVETVVFTLEVYGIEVDLSDYDLEKMIDKLEAATWPEYDTEAGDAENTIWHTLTWEEGEVKLVLCWLEDLPLLLE